MRGLIRHNSSPRSIRRILHVWTSGREFACHPLPLKETMLQRGFSFHQTISHHPRRHDRRQLILLWQVPLVFHLNPFMSGLKLRPSTACRPWFIKWSFVCYITSIILIMMTVWMSLMDFPFRHEKTTSLPFLPTFCLPSTRIHLLKILFHDI